MAEQSLGPGTVLAGRYRLVEQIGEGGMGSVWRAEHLTLRSSLAVKLIDVELASSQEVQTRFMREAQAAASLSSPHVVHIMDYGVESDVPFIAMELMHGEDLAHRLERLQRLSPAETARIITHVSRAVGKAHEAGIVHRDLKPDNVFIVRNEDDEIAKVLDFGVAKAVNPEASTAGSTDTRTGVVIGTPHYMSPEQARGDRRVDWRSDLWALAVITYECLLGVRPFEADGIGSLLLAICSEEIPIPSSVGPVPAGFDAWFAKAADRDPDARFQSAREMADALQQVLLGGAAVSLLPSLPGATPGSGPTELRRSEAVETTTDRAAATELAVAPAAPRSRAALFASAAGVLVVLGMGALLLRGGTGGGDASPAAAEPVSTPNAVPSLPSPGPAVDQASAAEAPGAEEATPVDAGAPATESEPAGAAVRAPLPRSARRPAPRPRVMRPAPHPPAPEPAPARPSPSPTPKKKGRDIGF